MAKIYIKFNGAMIKEVVLTKEETTFGRKPNNDIVIDHPTISGFHGKIKKEEDHYAVEDLNSTNGTFINGRRIKSSSVKDKDQIGVAGHIFEFHSDDTAPSLDAAEKAPADGSPEAAKIEEQKQMLKKALGIDADGKANGESAQSSVNKLPPGTGVVRIISGSVNGQVEVQLKDLVTYIGTTDQAAIKIKGFLVPSLAAAISRRPEGYFLKAVKAGYPKVNGNAVTEQVFLENGALIEVGGTNMVFYQSKKES